MAPLTNFHLPSLFNRAADAFSSTPVPLERRVLYYYQPNAGAVIAGVVISVLFLILVIVSIILRCKYGWWGYRRPYYSPTYISYAGPNNTGYNAGGGPPGYDRRWPGQTSHFPAPGQVGENGSELNAYGTPRGPGTYQPPPLYSGPGTFYQTGKYGQGTSNEVSPNRGASRLQEHSGLRNSSAQQ